jgi:ABC-type glycerol-3-phosphate transport system substrate-binding protein
LKELPASLALSFYAGFSNPSKAQYAWNRSLPNSQDVFTNGDLAIYFGFASEFTAIKEKNPNLNFDVALLPQISGAKTFNTFGNMLGLAILKTSADPAGAFTVLTALTGASAVPFWSKYFPLPSARRDVLGQVETNAIKTVFNQSAIMSKGWFDPNRSESSKIFQEMVESYVTGRDSLETAVNNASGRLDNLLK